MRRSLSDDRGQRERPVAPGFKLLARIWLLFTRFVSAGVRASQMGFSDTAVADETRYLPPEY